ncbi:class I SAM-dependent methyltransferase [Actinoplanes sp. NPDC049265]|uniref:class I SAM-dependent methyltransferase n=1 Tax=Actinoplanes sp. NPDC049265 TaxID=3363902 RepID=UPI0037119B46
MSDGDFSADWLTLREPADAAARDRGLVDVLRATLDGELVVRDLGCGTGSMGRWLAPRLGRRQHWVLMDRDPALLEHAREHLPEGVTVETRQGDVTGLTGADLTGTDLVTCSALLDLLTEEEVGALARACAEAGTAALFTLSVTGEVSLDPADPLDDDIAVAFNEHQRREAGGRRLLGPDAADVAAAAFRAAGASVTVRPAPWRLSTRDTGLAAEWLRGWVGAAVEQRPDLRVDEYLKQREADGFAARVGHADLLARFV